MTEYNFGSTSFLFCFSIHMSSPLIVYVMLCVCHAAVLCCTVSRLVLGMCDTDQAISSMARPCPAQFMLIFDTASSCCGGWSRPTSAALHREH